MSFLSKQFIDVIDWTEPEPGILSYRFPMEDQEIQNGGKLTVRDSEMAVFVNEGQIADIFSPGLHTLATQTLPLLTYLMNWDKDVQVAVQVRRVLLSTRLQTDQKWGTANPITIRDKEFGAVRIRAYGIYAYRISDPTLFLSEMSGTQRPITSPISKVSYANTIVGAHDGHACQQQINLPRYGRQPGRAGRRRC